MADGPETRITKPESMLFSAKLTAAEAAEGNAERTGQTGCTVTTNLHRQFDDSRLIFVGKHVTFSAKDPSFIES